MNFYMCYHEVCLLKNIDSVYYLLKISSKFTDFSLIKISLYIIIRSSIFRDRGSSVVKVLCYNRKVAGSIPNGVIGIFH